MPELELGIDYYSCWHQCQVLSDAVKKRDYDEQLRKEESKCVMQRSASTSCQVKYMVVRLNLICVCIHVLPRSHQNGRQYIYHRLKYEEKKIIIWSNTVRDSLSLIHFCF